MADFSEIPKGVLRKIAGEHVDHLEDVESFGEVCSVWRSESKGINHTNFFPPSNTQLPWLMLCDSPTNYSYRRFYSLSKRGCLRIDLPGFHEDDPDDDHHHRYFSSKGWLIGVSRKQALITFIDPFFGSVIKPPSMPLIQFMDGDLWDDTQYFHQFHKFIFSARPSSSCDDDFQVAMLFHTAKHIAFWRPGQQRWIEPPPTDDDTFSNRQIEDVCFFRGQFYSVDYYTQVIVFENEQKQKQKRPRIVANLKSLGLVPESSLDKYYIAVFGTALLVIQREVYLSPDSDYYGTLSFKLFELNVDQGKVKQVEDIGNRALFVGHNSTFFVDADADADADASALRLDRHRHRPGFRANSIYFTDDNQEFYDDHRGGGSDMGIYSLEQKRVVSPVYQGPSQFSHETPPLWVELPHY